MRLGGQHAQAPPAHDDQVALGDVGHGNAAGRPLRIDEDAAVHFLVLDVDPFALKADLRAVVRGRVEPLGKGAVDVRGHGDAVLLRDGDGPVVVDAVEHFPQDGGTGSVDLDAGIAGVGLALADADILDLVSRSMRQDLVEHLGQQQGIDDVALQLDLLDMRARSLRAGAGRKRG